MKPRIAFSLQNLALASVCLLLFVLLDRDQIFDFAFSGTVSATAMVFFIVLLSVCFIGAHCYERYARIYLGLKNSKIFFWIIAAASVGVFATFFGFMRYVVGANADLFSPQMSVIFILIGALNNLASITIIVIFLIFLLRKPVTHKHFQR